MIIEAFPQLAYSFPRTYLVESVGADGRLSLRPPTDAPHLRPLPKVPQWIVGGFTVTPVVGAEVVVGFRDASPGRPFVVGFAPGTPVDVTAEASGVYWIGEDATAVKAGKGAASVIRHGDTVSLSVVGSGIITVTSGTAEAPPAVSRLKG